MCEGKKGKAEYSFISEVIDEYRNDEDYSIISADGKNNIEKEFLRVKNSFNSGDVFILFFDNIETIGGKLTADLLTDICIMCSELGVVFRYTTYYCFEELFLSYTSIIDILEIDDSLRNELLSVQNKILTGKNYFREDISFWENYFGEHRCGSLKTREKLSSSICNDIFKRVNGLFFIQKNKIGECWVCDCANSKLHKNVCSRCNYILKGSSFRDKLKDIDSNSVSCLSLPFSTVFNSYR